MPNIISKAIEKVAEKGVTGESRRDSQPNNVNDRVIPLEPVQQQTSPKAIHEEDTTPGLHFHNFARANKGVRKLEWDNALAKEARDYAEKLAASGKLQQSDVEEGENLYRSSQAATFEAAVQAWLDEGNQYHGEKIGEGNSKQCLHYTQCLWTNTTHLGMGDAKSKDGATYIVARYSPKGNIAGMKPFQI